MTGGIQVMDRQIYDLNFGRPLPRALEIDVGVLAEFWAEFCTVQRVRLYAVLGYENELEQIKLWAAGNIIARAIERWIAKGSPANSPDVIIDSTSGNFGEALAYVIATLLKRWPDCPFKRVVAVIPENTPPGKRKRLTDRGVELREAPNSIAAMQMAEKLADAYAWFYARQYWNRDNADTYVRIAREIVRLFPDLGAYACGVGSGGTASGTIPYLWGRFGKRPFHTAAVVVEPGKSVSGVRHEAGIEPGSLKDWRPCVNDVRYIGPEDSCRMSEKLWRQKGGCIGGPSTGFALTGLLLSLHGLLTMGRLDQLRNESGDVEAVFIAPDTYKPYAEEYAKFGIELPLAA